MARVGGSRNAYGILVGKLTARDRLEDVRKILGRILKKYDRSVWIGSFGSELRLVACFYEYGNESWGSVKFGVFID